MTAATPTAAVPVPVATSDDLTDKVALRLYGPNRHLDAPALIALQDDSIAEVIAICRNAVADEIQAERMAHISIETLYGVGRNDGLDRAATIARGV